MGIAWDLIYIASSKYDREVEAEAGAEVEGMAGAEGGAVVEGGAEVGAEGGGEVEGGPDGSDRARAPLKLLVAGHRKVCAAYALSKAGANKIARCPTR